MRREKLFLILLLAFFALGQSFTPANAQQDIPELTILLDDVFDEPALWVETSGASFTTRFVDGVYEISNELPGSFVTSVQRGSLRDIFVETSAHVAAGSPTGYGVVCRWQDAHNFYGLLVRSDGQASIVRFIDGAGQTLAEDSVAVLEGHNRVGALCLGPRLHLIVDGEVVLSATDFAFDLGAAGMLVLAAGQDEAVVRFDHFLLAAVNPDLSETPVEFYPGIGPGERLYMVRPGDTLQSIAGFFQVSIDALMERNPHILDPELVYLWQPLAIPGGQAFPAALAPDTAAIIPQTGLDTVFYHPPDLHPNVALPFLHGDFEDETAWQVEPDLTAGHDDGIYRLDNDAEIFTASLRPFDLPFVHIEVDTRRAAGSTSGAYGVVCGWQDEGNYHAFVIDADGFPAILRVQNGTAQTLAQAQVQFDPGAWNQIGANCYGSLLTFYMEGVAVLQIIDPTLTGGHFGLALGPGVQAEFRSLTAYLPAGALVADPNF
jgi:LysM repeat protein